MNKAVFAFLASLLLTSVACQGQLYTIPSQYLTGSSCGGLSTVYNSIGISIGVDLKGYAASIGKNVQTWFGKFTYSFAFTGLRFNEAKYKVQHEQTTGYWCPIANAITCPLPKSYIYFPNDAYQMFMVQNPNFSIFQEATNRNSITIYFVTENRDSVVATYNVKCNPHVLVSETASKVIGLSASYNSTQQAAVLENSCIQTNITNEFKIIPQGAYYSVSVKVPLIAPMPLPNYLLNIFNSNRTPKFYWDNVEVTPFDTTYDSTTSTYTFWRLINFSVSNFNDGMHNFTMCQVRAPQMVFQPYTINLVTQDNIVVATQGPVIKSDRPVRTTSPWFTQSSYSPNTPVVLTTNITSAEDMGWMDQYKLMVTVPPILVGPYFMQVTVKSRYDNSVRNFNVSMSNQVTNITVAGTGVLLSAGLELTISGVSNPGNPTYYPWSFQLWSMFGYPYTAPIPNSQRVAMM